MTTLLDLVNHDALVGELGADMRALLMALCRELKTEADAAWDAASVAGIRANGEVDAAWERSKATVLCRVLGDQEALDRMDAFRAPKEVGPVRAGPFEARHCPACDTWIYTADGPFAEDDPTKTLADIDHYDREHGAESKPLSGGGVEYSFPDMPFNEGYVDAVKEEPVPDQPQRPFKQGDVVRTLGGEEVEVVSANDELAWVRYTNPTWKGFEGFWGQADLHVAPPADGVCDFCHENPREPGVPCCDNSVCKAGYLKDLHEAEVG